VADETAAVDRLKYLFRNGCQEGLVDRPGDWPGVNCVRALVSGGQKLAGTWFDRTAEHRARRRGENVAARQFATRYELHLAKLPCWQDLSPALYRAACADLVALAETETRSEHASSQQEPVGQDRLLAMDPHHRPLSPETSPAPLVHASCRHVRLAFRRAYATFVNAFRIAAAHLRQKQTADFPASAFPPSGRFVSPPPLPA
jgi:hypothetical protein